MSARCSVQTRMTTCCCPSSPTMTTDMRTAVPLLLMLSVVLPVAGCASPPPDAYVHGAVRAEKPAEQVSIGRNSVGEECTQQEDTSRSADVFCGTWQQPSA